MSTVASSVADVPHLANPDLNPSFTKGVFLGEIREDLVFPFPALADEERESLRMILDSFRAFAEDHVDSKRLDREGELSADIRDGMADLGLMGLNIAEAYGGFGASSKVFNRVFGEIGATDPALCVYFGAHQSIGCKGIALFGNEDQNPNPEHVNVLEEELKKQGKRYEFHRYDGAGHGFFYYHTPLYRPQQAMDGWSKVFTFFDKELA